MSFVNKASKVKTIRALVLENGVLSLQKVMDFGDTLAVKRTGKGGELWLAWAKGKPILCKPERFGKFRMKGYTYLLCPEVAWTLDEKGLVEIMRRGKAYLLKKLAEKVEDDGEEETSIEENLPQVIPTPPQTQAQIKAPVLEVRDHPADPYKQQLEELRSAVEEKVSELRWIGESKTGPIPPVAPTYEVHYHTHLAAPSKDSDEQPPIPPVSKPPPPSPPSAPMASRRVRKQPEPPAAPLEPAPSATPMPQGDIQVAQQPAA
jgi:hypothetical protein